MQKKASCTLHERKFEVLITNGVLSWVREVVVPAPEMKSHPELLNKACFSTELRLCDGDPKETGDVGIEDGVAIIRMPDGTKTRLESSLAIDTASLDSSLSAIKIDTTAYKDQIYRKTFSVSIGIVTEDFGTVSIEHSLTEDELMLLSTLANKLNTKMVESCGPDAPIIDVEIIH